jgi:hypothetical protein
LRGGDGPAAEVLVGEIAPQLASGSDNL